MDSLTTITSTMTAAFLGSAVEIVEAFTIVLAVGLTTGWRPAFIGTGVALALLTLMVLIFGPLLGQVPIGILQFVVGVLLGLFGLRWLRKAILRASGYIALHDEEMAFAKETAVLSAQKKHPRPITWVAWRLSRLCCWKAWKWCSSSSLLVQAVG